MALWLFLPLALSAVALLVLHVHRAMRSARVVYHPLVERRCECGNKLELEESLRTGRCAECRHGLPVVRAVEAPDDDGGPHAA